MNKLFKFFMLFTLSLSIMVVSCNDDETATPEVPSPTITSVSPTEGEVGTVVTITGTNLQDVNRVTFGGTNAEGFVAANNTANTVTATVPAGLTAGAQNITVTSPGGTANFNFTVTEEEEEVPVVAAPTITEFSPLEGPVGTTITITGTGFVAENIDSIMIGEMVVEEFTVVDETSITFDVPEGAETGTITITPTEGEAVVSIHSFTVTEVDPTATIVEHNDVVVNAQGVRNQEGMVTAFSAQGETFTLQEGTDSTTSVMIDFIAADSGGDEGLDLFSPSHETWLPGNYFEDSDDIPVVWPVRNETRMVHLEGEGADFFENITAAELAALTIGEEFETRVEIQPNADGTPNVPQVILFETANGQKGLILYKGHNPNAEEGTKADIFTFDIKVLETEETE